MHGTLRTVFKDAVVGLFVCQLDPILIIIVVHPTSLSIEVSAFIKVNPQPVLAAGIDQCVVSRRW
jgi:hypothetical protein